jgi:hypothetical protein
MLQILVVCPRVTVGTRGESVNLAVTVGTRSERLWRGDVGYQSERVWCGDGGYQE